MVNKNPPPSLTVETYKDYQVITQPNPLRKVLRYVEPKEDDDPIARAEEALAGLSGEFTDWMKVECDRLSTAHTAIIRDGFNKDNSDELFRAAHDIKGGAATFGYPQAADAAESLCRIIEHAPDLKQVPEDLITHHINAIQAIIREKAHSNKSATADALSHRLRNVADEYLIHVNKDRPEHLEAIMSPSIAPSNDPAGT